MGTTVPSLICVKCITQAETDRDNGIIKARHTVDMIGDALTRQVFIDDQLIEWLCRPRIAQEAVGQWLTSKRKRDRQSELSIERQYNRTDTIVLYAPFEIIEQGC